MKEERWIEADGDGQITDFDNDDDDEPDIGDLFADPDPFDTFDYSFPSIPKITLQGVKAENGQTLKSTGLTVWRASPLLCDYIVSEPERIQNKTVLELGAGLGLCGIVAYHMGARKVVLTDGDTDTLAEMRINVANNTTATTTRTADITCQQLRWGRNVIAFRDEYGTFDLILASDVIYVVEIIEPLLDTVVALMAVPHGQFLLSYARRNVNIDLVLASATRHGLTWSEPPGQEGVYVFERK